MLRVFGTGRYSVQVFIIEMLIIHESHLGQCAGIGSNGKPVFTAERRVVLVPVPADSH